MASKISNLSLSRRDEIYYTLNNRTHEATTNYSNTYYIALVLLWSGVGMWPKMEIDTTGRAGVTKPTPTQS